MTDKEWKELCDWVKSLNDNYRITVLSDTVIRFYGCSKNLEFYSNGEIWCDCECLIGLRTAKQIKAIIESLL